MFCPKCGKEMLDGAKFCGKCGHHLEKEGSREQGGKKAKKNGLAVLGVCVFALLSAALWIGVSTGGCMLHSWQEATCIKPEICSKCGKIRGKAPRHTWEKATCTAPETCSKCGKTMGEAAGHTWEKAACTKPETCSVCGETRGESLGGHVWEEATCTQPETCSVCKETKGALGEHDWKEATCTEPKTCRVCKETEGESLGGHVWEEATCTKPKICKRCRKPEGKKLGHDWTEVTCTELAACNRCHADLFLGRHKMNSDTGICEICGKELKVALDKSNWRKYLFVGVLHDESGFGFGYKEWREIAGQEDCYRFEDAVLGLDCRITQENRYYDTKKREWIWYSISTSREFEVRLTADGGGYIGRGFDETQWKLDGFMGMSYASGFVIIGEDEYEVRKRKEGDDVVVPEPAALEKVQGYGAAAGVLHPVEGAEGSVTFGTYEQDANPENGQEPIEWLVLGQKDGQILLLSKYALDAQCYYATDAFAGDIGWEQSTLRAWLNDSFYNTAFGEEEKKRIASSHIVSKWNGETIVEETDDYVFLLSDDEVKDFFNAYLSSKDGAGEDSKLGSGKYHDALICEQTEYATRQGLMKKRWALRCYKAGGYDVQAYNAYGELQWVPDNPSNVGVRPAVWVNID